MSCGAFATLADVLALTGVDYTAAEQERITAMLPLVSDSLRWEGEKAGLDLDARATASTVFASVLKTVTVDVTARVMRQSNTGADMTQESQTAGPYTWSGTYAIPGGGIAQAIMNNDLKRLGLKRQRVKAVDLYAEDSRRQREPDGADTDGI